MRLHRRLNGTSQRATKYKGRWLSLGKDIPYVRTSPRIVKGRGGLKRAARRLGIKL